MSGQTTEALEVRIGRRIAAAPQRIWEVLSTPEGMREWLGSRTFEPQPGGRVLFDAQHNDQRWIMYGAITAFKPARELAFSWREVDAAAGTVWPADTLVSITLTPDGDGTYVELRHSGFEALPDGAAQHAGYAEGWASLNDLEQLAAMCEGPA